MNSEWNMALSTLERIDRGIRICNDGLFNGDFSLWLRGIYWFYGEMSTWMNEKEQKDFIKILSPCKNWRGESFQENLDNFQLATQSLRRTAHKNKLLLKEEEDTTQHGGKV